MLNFSHKGKKLVTSCDGVKILEVAVDLATTVHHTKANWNDICSAGTGSLYDSKNPAYSAIIAKPPPISSVLNNGSTSYWFIYTTGPKRGWSIALRLLSRTVPI